jgi:tRNA pseudouridine32 synthase / 23S rRNA pseudouridine746 synthase
MTDTIIELHPTVSKSGCTAIELLSQHTDLSKQTLKNAMNKGCVWLTHGQNTKRLRRVKKIIPQHSTLHLYYNEHILAQTLIAPVLIADNNDFSVWDKPYGMRSQGSKWGDHTSINRWVEQHHRPQRNTFIVHRLDRAATGLILIAHTKSMAHQLSQLFQKRTIEKTYHAIVSGQLSDNVITCSHAIDGKHAVSHIRRIDHCPKRDISLVSIQIETGRKHQIRKHLSEIGHPILGDRQYNPHANHEVNLQLRAYELRFQLPNTTPEHHYQSTPLRLDQIPQG